MPYLITDDAEGCSGWATIKDDGEVMGCHTSKQDAIDQALAIAQEEGSEFLGERAMIAPDVFTTQQEAADRADEIGCEGTHSMDQDGNTVYMPCSTHEAYMDATGTAYRAEPGDLELGDFVEWDSSGGMARGTIEQIITDGQLDIPDSDFVINGSEDDPAALIQVWRPDEEDGRVFWAPSGVLVGHRFSTLTKIDPLPMEDERRQVNLDPPAYMRASARRGLEWHSEGFSGDGLEPRTVEEARALAEGNVTPAKWGRIAAFIARHLVDLEAPAASPDHPDYPSPGVVSMALWGGGVNKRQAERAMEYARGVVSRIEEDNDERSTVTGEAKSALETRHFHAEMELRETPEGMFLEGYAARFNEFSQPLPFREKIAPGAFKRSLQTRNDVKLLWNHDSSTVLGSTRAGTLSLMEDQYGLRVSAQLPDTQAGRDAKVLIQRRDVTAFSFGFTVPEDGDSWNSDGSERTLHSIRLFEVSTGVAFPAYPTTDGTATVRGLARVARRAEVDVDALADAVLKIENGEDISAADRVMIESVLEELAPATDGSEPAESDEEEKARQLLQLKKKKLQLLMGA
jgi:HK97 family phage prohead protease